MVPDGCKKLLGDWGFGKPSLGDSSPESRANVLVECCVDCDERVALDRCQPANHGTMPRKGLVPAAR